MPAHGGARSVGTVTRPVREERHERRADHSADHRADPRLLGHAAQLGELEGLLRGRRPPGPHARLPRARGRGRGAQRRPDADREADGPRDRRPPRLGHRRARGAAHPDGPLGRRRDDPAADGPRLRLGRRRDQLRPHRGRAGRAAVADQGHVRGAQEPGEPPPRGGVHPRAVAVRVHQRLPRGAVARAVRAAAHPGVGRHLLGQRPLERQARPPGDLGRLPQRRPRAAAVHVGRARTT